jgi:hypothetical protein
LTNPTSPGASLVFDRWRRRRQFEARMQIRIALLVYGPSSLYELRQRAELRSARLAGALTDLEMAGEVMSFWEEREDGVIPRRFYQLVERSSR